MVEVYEEVQILDGEPWPEWWVRCSGCGRDDWAGDLRAQAEDAADWHREVCT